MSTDECRRLCEAELYARPRRETKVITLMGGNACLQRHPLKRDPGAEDPAGGSWRNLHAINDIVREIVETDPHLGSRPSPVTLRRAACFRARADHVVARGRGVNPFYRHMGGLYGAEYWT